MSITRTQIIVLEFSWNEAVRERNRSQMVRVIGELLFILLRQIVEVKEE